jgi:hypothetical protein
MRRLAVPLSLALASVVLAIAGCAPGSAPVLATFTRDWGDGRTETLELHEDGKVVMNHVGYLDRVTLSAEDTARLAASLRDIAPAGDPAALPRLTLAPASGTPVVVDTGPGTAGELFLSLLDRHRLP